MGSGRDAGRPGLMTGTPILRPPAPGHRLNGEWVECGIGLPLAACLQHPTVEGARCAIRMQHSAEKPCTPPPCHAAANALRSSNSRSALLERQPSGGSGQSLLPLRPTLSTPCRAWRSVLRQRRRRAIRPSPWPMPPGRFWCSLVALWGLGASTVTTTAGTSGAIGMGCRSGFPCGWSSVRGDENAPDHTTSSRTGARSGA